jgi:hypothetical protein
MKYRGIELKEIDTKNINPIVYDTPHEMLVWDDGYSEPRKEKVYAILPARADGFQVLTYRRAFGHGAEIPEQKLATHRELARWLAQGNGEVKGRGDDLVTYTWLPYPIDDADKPVPEKVFVRTWDDEDWHAPTREYLGLENT